MDVRIHLPTATEVDTARANISDSALRTPLWRLDVDAPSINIYLKLENLQPLGSFKIRAAVNAIKSRDPQSLRDGVLSASAGNFGQGLVMAARRMGIKATIIAPDSAAQTKTAALE
ncbi:MAG: pyridoxal-phosphate dependent enzyme, partial [Terriglobia bacterium]